MSIMESSRKRRLQLVQARVDEALPFFGRVILGVFAQVAVGPSFQNLPRQLDAQLVFERRNLFLELLDEGFHVSSARL